MSKSDSPEIKRSLNLREVLEKKSCFLFGPRQTGKSTLIRQQFPDAAVYNLLLSDTFTALSRDPSLIRKENPKRNSVIVIDEIQKLPTLLDEVHAMIEDRHSRFLLTGSSSRKLKRSGVNLLGGRARERRLFPFSFGELGREFDLEKALKFGLLPSVYFSDAPEEDLESYGGYYLQNEIAAEALVRSLPSFSRFLRVAANCDGQLLKYTQIGSDAQVPKTTVIEYFKILEETYVGSELHPYLETEKRKPIESKKFYFFDCGVARALRGEATPRMKTPQMGGVFENYIHHELTSYSHERRCEPLNYWRSTSKFEVDFILNKKIAIEAKAKSVITTEDLKGLRALREENQMSRYYVVSFVERARKEDFIEILPVKEFLTRLWHDDLGA
jgi:predicted AAA+ superfamily ATPase